MRGRKLIVDWKHTAEELYARYKQERNTHIAKRLQALFLLRRGTPTRQVALIVGVSRMSIHKWLTWYRTGGLDELTRRTRGGNRIPVRPRLTPDQQAQRIQHATTQGFRTLREAAAWCRETAPQSQSDVPLRRAAPSETRRQQPIHHTRYTTTHRTQHTRQLFNHPSHRTLRQLHAQCLATPRGCLAERAKALRSGVRDALCLLVGGQR